MSGFGFFVFMLIVYFVATKLFPDNGSSKETFSPHVNSEFLGNLNNNKVHSKNCSKAKYVRNKVEFDTLEEAKTEGFEMCIDCINKSENKFIEKNRSRQFNKGTIKRTNNNHKDRDKNKTLKSGTNGKGSIIDSSMDINKNFDGNQLASFFKKQIQKAVQCKRDGEYNQSINIYKELFGIDPNVPQVHEGMGKACAAAGRYSDSVDCFLFAAPLYEAIGEAQKAELCRAYAETFGRPDKNDQAFLEVLAAVKGN